MPIPTLAEKLAWLKPAPATPYEKECAAKVPQGDYEIGVQITNDILDEAMEVFVRSSRSYFGVSGDSMVALFTAGGDLINASCGTYLHAIIQPIVIKFILKYYEKNPGIRDGDIWYTNDALYGGIHNPDQVALMPVFYKGQLLAWASAALHTTETGAIEPGGMPVSAKSRFEEGLNLPPIKIGENFEIRNDFLEFYSVYGLRAPAMFISDLRARCTTADRVRVRVLELAEKRGPDFVVGLMRKMCETAEAGAAEKNQSPPRRQIPRRRLQRRHRLDPRPRPRLLPHAHQKRLAHHFQFRRHLARKSLLLQRPSPSRRRPHRQFHVRIHFPRPAHRQLHLRRHRFRISPKASFSTPIKWPPPVAASSSACNAATPLTTPSPK